MTPSEDVIVLPTTDRRETTTNRALTRRDLLSGGLTLAALLTGCGYDDQAEPAGATSAGFPRTFRTAHGSIRIPDEPRRIVTLGREAEVVLALGITPVGMLGAEFGDGVEPYLRNRIAGRDVEILDVTDGAPFERIAALNPDVILAGTYVALDAEHARLSEIAPVVGYVRGSYVDTWQEQATLIGQALGREAAAATEVDRRETRIRRIAARHPSWRGRTFSLSFNYQPGTLTSVTKQEDIAIRLLGQFGLRLSPQVSRLKAANEFGQPDISYELVSVLDAHVMIVAHATRDIRTQLERLPTFATLPAVREGRYVRLDLTTVSVLRTPMLLGIDHALDTMVPQIENALR